MTHKSSMRKSASAEKPSLFRSLGESSALALSALVLGACLLGFLGPGVSHRFATCLHDPFPAATSASPTLAPQAREPDTWQGLVPSGRFLADAGNRGDTKKVGTGREGVSRVQVYGDACGYTEADVERFLRVPHGRVAGERRFFVNATWQSIDQLEATVKSSKYVVPYRSVLCVLAYLYRQVPCRDAACLVPVRIRPHFSDFSVLRQILEKQRFEFLHQYNFTSVLDAGANVGLTTMAFALQFPHSRVVAVEMSGENYNVLRQNTHYLPNVVAVNAGLFNTIKTLTFDHYGGENATEGWAYVLNGSSDARRQRKRRKLMEGSRKLPQASIMTVTVDLLMQQFGVSSFDFIKMDVEGSEKEIFTPLVKKRYNPGRWISKAKMLAIETHDRMKNGSTQAVKEAMSRYGGFDWAKCGEYHVWFDGKLLPHPREGRRGVKGGR